MPGSQNFATRKNDRLFCMLILNKIYSYCTLQSSDILKRTWCTQRNISKLTSSLCNMPHPTAYPNNNLITSWTEDIIRTAYSILGPWCDEINFCCFICVTQWRALHDVIKWQFFLHFIFTDYRPINGAPLMACLAQKTYN